MKTITSKIAPNPKEAQFWIDLTADPHGKIQKYWDGKKWVVMGEKQTDNTKFNTEVIEILKVMTNKIEILTEELADHKAEIKVLKEANVNNINRINTLEKSIITE